jgi:hypothetical protein
MFPSIYDTPRIVQTLNDELDVQMVGINGAPTQEGQKQAYDLTKGKYRVRITTGASYTTKRQEEAAFLAEVFQRDPELMKVGGDILFNSLDTPGAQALAARLKKTIPPQLLDDGNNQDPRVTQLMQALQQAQQQMQQMSVALESKQTEDQAKLIKANADLIKAKTEAVEAITPQQNTTKDQAPAQPAPNPIDMDENQLMGLLQDKQNQKQQQAIEAQNNAQIEMQREQFETQQHQQDMVLRMEQTKAVLTTLTAIAGQLNALTAQVSAPKRVMRDPETGAIVGVQ